MQEFQVVFAKLTGRRRDDEETVTDLLNERARTGWQLHSSTAVETTRLMLVFERGA